MKKIKLLRLPLLLLWFCTLLGRLGAILLGSLLASKSDIRAGEETIRAVQKF